MTVAASGPKSEILQVDWFISGRVFPVWPAQGGDLKTPCLCQIKTNVLTNYEAKVYCEQSEKQKQPCTVKLMKKFYMK